MTQTLNIVPIDPGIAGSSLVRSAAIRIGRSRPRRAGARMSVEVLAQSFEGHTEQIYTGLSILASDRRIDLLVRPQRLHEFVTDGEPERLWQWQVPAIVDGVRVLFDVHDSATTDPYASEWADIVLKRSHDPRVGSAHQFPLGLNMEIYRSKPDRYVLARLPITFAARRQIRYLATGLGVWQRLRWRPTVEYFDRNESHPTEDSVVFVTRAWEPPASLSPEVAADWCERNERRAGLVRALRSYFGSRVHAWMAPTDYARTHFGDCVAENFDQMDQRRYFERVRNSAVTVTTEGLFGSTGWRFAEAIALGAAIVTEPPRFCVAEELLPGRNYLAARTADEFASAIDHLLSRPADAAAMRRSNRVYWARALRPDELAWRALTVVRAFTAP